MVCASMAFWICPEPKKPEGSQQFLDKDPQPAAMSFSYSHPHVLRWTVSFWSVFPWVSYSFWLLMVSFFLKSLGNLKFGSNFVMVTPCHCAAIKFPGIKHAQGTSLVVQWLRLCAPNAGGPGLIPSQGTGSHMYTTTKSSHAATKEPTCLN